MRRRIGRALGVLALLAASLAAGAAPTRAVEVAGDGAPEAAPARRPGKVPRGHIRVASFNIAWFTGVADRGFVPRSEHDLVQVARVVRGTHAHVICLQEVVDLAALERLGADMTRLAQGEAEYTCRLEDGSPLYWSGERAMGQQVGIVYDRKRIRIPRAGPLEGEEAGVFTRPPVFARVEVLDSPLAFDLLGVHLKSGVLSERDSRIRAREVDAVLAWMATRRQAGSKDILLLGDFNAPRDHESLEALDTLADEGKLVAIEDHFHGPAVGTHIPWDVGLDRAFMTHSLWKKAGVEGSAAVYRYEEFLPGAREKEFCVRTRWPVRSKELRCDCEAPAAEGPVEEEASAEGSADDTTMSLPAMCEGGARWWAKVENYLRVSDHRPIMWDLRLQPRRRRKPAAGGER